MATKPRTEFESIARAAHIYVPQSYGQEPDPETQRRAVKQLSRRLIAQGPRSPERAADALLLLDCLGLPDSVDKLLTL